MARLIFSLVSIVCMFQTLAAPFRPRAEALDCDKSNVNASLGIDHARRSLATINVINDIANARNILLAQVSLVDANNASTNIAVSLGLGPKKLQPNQTDQAQIVESLLASQATLNKTALLDNSTAQAIKEAQDAISTTLVTAQQVLANPCTLH